MKTFVINLERETHKKEYITNECNKLNLDFEIYKAVDGSQLSEEFLKEHVHDYGNNFLAKGEIGCALSHINIYKKIVEQNLPYALILEDDAVLDAKLPDFIAAFEKTNKRQGIFLFGDYFTYISNKKISIGSFNIFPIYEAYLTTGYIITLKAAKEMLNFLLPIRYEADMFKIFRTYAGINIYATVPHLVGSNDTDRSNSNIELERQALAVKRSKYKRHYYKNHERKRKIALFFWRIFLRKFEVKKRYHIQ